MKRVNSFKYFLSNFFGIIELFNSNLEKRQPNLEISSLASQLYSVKLSNEDENIYGNVQAILIALIKQTCNQISEFYSEKQVNTFSFILAAFADEFILDSNISQNEKWSNYLVERAMFSTSISGEELFINISEHIKIHSSKDNEMSYLYYYILCLGYKGMHRKNYREVGYFKISLLNTISSDFLLPVADKINYISPGNYQFIIKSQKLNNIMNYSFLYKNIISSIFGMQIIFISYVWLFYIKSKISNIA